jgi:magnesium chelatase subunit I
MKSYLKLTRHRGNSTLYMAAEMSLISIMRGHPLHIHTEGLRGTGKTSIMRSIKQIMPKITRIKGCLYNCDPLRPHCPSHRDMTPDEIVALGTEEITMPLLEISHSAKIGTVAGSIDLSRLTSTEQPEAALLPGIIPQAHRGIIFIDEINRLADTSPEITDVLLDVMGTKPGRVQIEETGMPIIEVPVLVSVWAASNPDEEPGPLAEIRRQLSDRFDMVVPMGRPSTPAEVMDILSVNEAARHAEHEITPSEWRDLERTREEMITIARQPELSMPEYLSRFLANLYINFNIESLRSLEAISQAALLHCAWRKRNQVMVSDITAVLPLTLNHRVSPATLANIMSTVNNRTISDEHNSSTVDNNGNNHNTDQTKGSLQPAGISILEPAAVPEEEPAPPQKAHQLRDLLSGIIKKD